MQKAIINVIIPPHFDYSLCIYVLCKYTRTSIDIQELMYNFKR